MKRNTLSYRIISRLLPAVMIIGAAILIAYYLFARSSISEHTSSNAQMTAKNTVHSIEEIVKQAELIPSNLAWMMESGSLTNDSLYGFLNRLVTNNPLIYASAIAFEPDKTGHLFSPYAYRKGSEVESINLGSESYNYLIMDWYQIPAMLKKPYWTEPYFDEGGADALLSTYSHPFYLIKEGKREFAGIITIDISLDWLTEIVNSVEILETGYALLISGNGVYVTHPSHENIMNHTIFTRAIELGLPKLRQIGRSMIKGEEGFSTLELPQIGKALLYYEPITSTGWSLGVVYPYKEMYASLQKLNLVIVILSLIALSLLIFFTFTIVNRMLGPLTKFAHSAREVAEGNFTAELPQIKSKDEMRELRDSFEFMQRELSEYITNLKETTTAKEKIESELRIAKEIQMGMIPHIFPPFPQIKQIDLFALLESAKEVGGDLYDFFLLDDKHLCFAIGDVSGKGIPASLFMAVTRTLLRSLAQKEKTTAMIVSEINTTLCFNNDSNMFVTFFLGILDTTTGELRYCNAGHNPPVLVKNDGLTTFFDITKGIPLGLYEDFAFTEQITSLKSGDTLFLYTDGLTEAENCKNELFSDQKLIETIQSAIAKSPADLVKYVLESVRNHVNGNEQSDDLTMLGILYKGDEVSTDKEMSAESDINMLPAINEWVVRRLKQLGLPDGLENTVNLVIEEAFSNIVFYAYEPGQKGKIDISLYLDGEMLVIELRDKGKPFDPTAAEDPDTTLPAEKREIGGLGIFLIKKMTDRVEYRREERVNVLIIKKKVESI
jgi:sigma-B regulation protein RsbU (phosphoserine phosphatase)